MFQFLLSGIISQPTYSVICHLDVNTLMAGRNKDTFLGKKQAFRSLEFRILRHWVTQCKWRNLKDIRRFYNNQNTNVKQMTKRICKARLIYTNFVTISFYDSIILISLVCGNYKFFSLCEWKISQLCLTNVVAGHPKLIMFLVRPHIELFHHIRQFISVLPKSVSSRYGIIPSQMCLTELFSIINQI